jgi:hypothetical protein
MIYESKQAYVEATGAQGCAVDVSWSGGYDIDGDPMPHDQKYSPCGKPAVGVHRDTPLCAKHWMNFVEHEEDMGNLKEQCQ